MMQGRKSRTALALGCALAMIAGVAAIAPAFAGAQGAAEEYDLGTVPEPDGDPVQQSAGGGDGGGDGDDSTAAAASAGSSGSGSDPTSGAPGTDAKGDQQRGDAGGTGGGAGGGDRTQGDGADDQGLVASSPDQASNVGADPSDDGGAPILLISLAVIAAVCTGLAIWRLRRGSGESDDGERGTTGAHGVTSET